MLCVFMLTGACTPIVSASCDTTYPVGASVPNVLVEQTTQLKVGVKLPKPIKSAATSSTTGSFGSWVQASGERSHVVNIDALRDGPYNKACSCGRVAIRKLWCSHVSSVIYHTTLDWLRFLKPWLTVRSHWHADYVT